MPAKAAWFVLLAAVLLTAALYVYYSSVSFGGVWRPVVRVVPDAPFVGDGVTIYVDLVYTGVRPVRIDPAELVDRHAANLSVVRVLDRALYLSKAMNRENYGGRSVTLNPGDHLTVAYLKMFFTDPGQYSIRAAVTGPGLMPHTAETEVTVKPKPLQISYENTSEAGNWTLTLRAEPLGACNGLAVNVTLRYVGHSRMVIWDARPRIYSVEVIHFRGDYTWSYLNQTSPTNAEEDVAPGYSQTLRLIIGSNTSKPHLSPGIYRVEARASTFTENGAPLNIDATIFIVLKNCYNASPSNRENMRIYSNPPETLVTVTPHLIEENGVLPRRNNVA